MASGLRFSCCLPGPYVPPPGAPEARTTEKLPEVSAGSSAVGTANRTGAGRRPYVGRCKSHVHIMLPRMPSRPSTCRSSAKKYKNGERNESAPHCLLHLEMLCCLCLRCCEGFVFYLPVRLGRRKALFSPLMNAQRLLARGSLLGGGLFLRRRRRFLRRTLLGRA